MAGIPRVDYGAILTQLHTEFVRDFEATFNISGNATLRCRNEDIPQFNAFIQIYLAYFRENEILLGHLVLLPVGQRDIETANDNKTKIMRLYGVAFHLYLKSCRFLGRQVNPLYSDIVLVKIEDE